MLKEAKTVIEEINNIQNSLYNVAKIMANNDDINWNELMYMRDAIGRNCAMFIETWYNKIMDIRVMEQRVMDQRVMDQRVMDQRVIYQKVMEKRVMEQKAMEVV